MSQCQGCKDAVERMDEMKGMFTMLSEDVKVVMGNVSKILDTYVTTTGGVRSKGDLKSYRGKWCDGLSSDVRDAAGIPSAEYGAGTDKRALILVLFFVSSFLSLSLSSCT